MQRHHVAIINSFSLALASLLFFFHFNFVFTKIQALKALVLSLPYPCSALGSTFHLRWDDKYYFTDFTSLSLTLCRLWANVPFYICMHWDVLFMCWHLRFHYQRLWYDIVLLLQLMILLLFIAFSGLQISLQSVVHSKLFYKTWKLKWAVCQSPFSENQSKPY